MKIWPPLYNIRKEHSQVLFYTEKAAAIYRKFLSATDPDVIRIEQRLHEAQSNFEQIYLSIIKIESILRVFEKLFIFILLIQVCKSLPITYWFLSIYTSASAYIVIYFHSKLIQR